MRKNIIRNLVAFAGAVALSGCLGGAPSGTGSGTGTGTGTGDGTGTGSGTGTGTGTGNGWNWPGGGGRLQILRATFGAGDRDVDVTSQLASQVRGDTLRMVVNRGSMGNDPAPGQAKRLKIIYLWQGLRYETNVPENGTVSLP